jgi:hypothetical protein
VTIVIDVGPTQLEFIFPGADCGLNQIGNHAGSPQETKSKWARSGSTIGSRRSLMFLSRGNTGLARSSLPPP